MPPMRPDPPPLTEDLSPLAWLNSPPLTEEATPLALLKFPPLTEDHWPLAALATPPLTEDSRPMAWPEIFAPFEEARNKAMTNEKYVNLTHLGTCTAFFGK